MAGALLIPGADHRLDGTWNGSCTPMILCFHTAVSTRPAPAATVSLPRGGGVVQHRRANAASSANLNGNYRVAAVECMDNAPVLARDIMPLDAGQIADAINLCVWYHLEWGIPLVFTMDSRPGSRGISVHRAGIDGNFANHAFPGRLPGGELWSSAYGKECPTDPRIAQIRDIVVPAARRRVGLETGRSLIVATAEEMDEIARRTANLLVWGMPIGVGGDRVVNLGTAWSETHQYNRQILGEVDGVEEGVAQMYAAVDSLEASAAAELARDNAEVGRDAATAASLAGLADDERVLLAAFRDPNNPANAALAARILDGVETIVAADQDTEVVLGPEHVEAMAHAVLGGLEPRLRPAVAAGLSDVFARLAETEQEPAE